MRCGGEEAIVGRMPAINIWMRDAAEDGEVFAMFAEQFEIRRKFVALARILGKEMFRQQAKVIADAEHAARFAAGRLVGALDDGSKSGSHAIEQRQ